MAIGREPDENLVLAWRTRRMNISPLHPMEPLSSQDNSDALVIFVPTHSRDSIQRAYKLSVAGLLRHVHMFTRLPGNRLVSFPYHFWPPLLMSVGWGWDYRNRHSDEVSGRCKLIHILCHFLQGIFWTNQEILRICDIYHVRCHCIRV